MEGALPSSKCSFNVAAVLIVSLSVFLSAGASNCNANPNDNEPDDAALQASAFPPAVIPTLILGLRIVSFLY